jgi:adenine C2-methylase RlmN of 23S rRNA A2503 and tRNA A37
VIFEYALIEGINDSVYCADRLALILRNMQCHVNLIL